MADKKQSKASLSHTYLEPNRADFVDWKHDKTLTAYLESVIQWHGYMRFVSLPHLRDNPDVVIDRLFIEPSLARRPISPDAAQAAWEEADPAQKVIETHPRLVVLGDPGSGKSTLVHWLAWALAKYTPLSKSAVLAGLIPLPMTLRDLSIGRSVTWEGLVSAFLKHEMCRPIATDSSVIRAWLSSGQAFVLLDGLDEIGSVEVRSDLRNAVFDGMAQYPKCRWLLTSRVVGYDLVPFHGRDAGAMSEEKRPSSDACPPDVRQETQVAYYATPFDDTQVARFAQNWFNEREAARERAYTGAQNFIAAIRSHPTTTRLSRTPNLLTMMALIYRVKARLPHGRTLLYNQIAEAYLQSIDTYRKIQELEYPLEQKQRWLSRVGFEMQRRRSRLLQGTNPDGTDGTREILVSGEVLRGWIAEAMAESGYGRDEQAAGIVVDHIGRRSGLLLPRGEDQFAFMHLSFQEYFAACHIEERITSPQWYAGKAELWKGLNSASFWSLARETAWRETLIFLAERLAHHPDRFEAFLDDLFGSGFGQIKPEIKPEDVKSGPAAVLLAALAVDPHTGFTSDRRREAIAACLKWVVTEERHRESLLWVWSLRVVKTLFAAEPHDLEMVWSEFIRAVQTARPVVLIMVGTRVVDLQFIAGLTNLKGLDLHETPIVDLQPLADLASLEELILSATQVVDLQSIAGLTNLKALDLSGTTIVDLQPLAGLTNLKALNLSGTQIVDLQPLAGLANLERLYMQETLVTDADLTQFHEERKKRGLGAVKIERGHLSASDPG